MDPSWELQQLYHYSGIKADTPMSTTVLSLQSTFTPCAKKHGRKEPLGSNFNARFQKRPPTLEHYCMAVLITAKHAVLGLALLLHILFRSSRVLCLFFHLFQETKGMSAGVSIEEEPTQTSVTEGSVYIVVTAMVS